MKEFEFLLERVVRLEKEALELKQANETLKKLLLELMFQYKINSID